MKVVKKPRRFLSTEEIAKVIAAARSDVPPRLQLMIFAGLRKGELRHLEWDDVDLKNRLLHVRPKEMWGPKTENSTRTLPLCDAAFEALQMAKVRSEKRMAKSSLVFPGRKGGYHVFTFTGSVTRSARKWRWPGRILLPT